MLYNSMTRNIEYIVIHESDTENGKTYTASDIEQWHKERKEWGPSKITHKYIGYHWVIDVDGVIEAGRHPDEIGAHAKGYNTNSLGICLIGRGKYTQAQWDSLQTLLGGLIAEYPKVKIIGHNQISRKTCPDFDVPAYVKSGFVPDEKNILHK